MIPDYAGRRTRALDAAQVVDVDALLVTDLVNVRYLTGFSGSNAALALAPGGPVLVTDRRYEDQAAQECPGLDVVLERDAALGALRVLGGSGAAAVAIEADVMPVAQFHRLSAIDGAPALRPESALVSPLRRVKDAYEVSCLEEACRIAVEALVALTEEVRPGVSEQALAGRYEQLLRDCGADDRAFPSIVASGPNSAIPHHVPTTRPLERGDLLVIDVGASVRGYHSDMTRTFVVAADPSADQSRLHDAVAGAATAALGALGPGVPAKQPYAAALESLAAHGLGDRFTHGLGHGVGLEVHEAPIMSATSAATIVAGDVLTIEPGAYLPGFGGVRIEDTVVVAETGNRFLTDLSRECGRLG
ncbi:MAG: Xaa-Pro peptidase family protein [Candidatus Nanopelagicales bacterium]|nr:Xaa-Pro peptidase family protein [Candidatus Nanopelagicales bacterium]MDZ4249375.1 Xaa-Pro peptidase family protein [Candidatus Nanopelagicales bacterium]